MSKLMLVALLIACSASLTMAQKKYHKWEVAGGYSIMQADGIVGDGDVFTDKPSDRLTLNSDPFTDGFVAQNNPATNPPGLFPIIPYSNSGKHHRAKLNGFNASATYNFSKYFGVKFEVSGNYRSNEIGLPHVVLTIPPPVPNPSGFRRIAFFDGVCDLCKSDQKNYNYLGGLQIKNNSTEKKFKPFVHVLAGISQQSVKLTNIRAVDFKAFKIYGTDKITNKGFAVDFGGGIDIRLSKRLDLRVVQFDYNPVRIKEHQVLAFKQAITGINGATDVQYSAQDVKVRARWQNNFRIGFGIVFH